jgi:hypothetical protein
MIFGPKPLSLPPSQSLFSFAKLFVMAVGSFQRTVLLFTAMGAV